MSLRTKLQESWEKRSTMIKHDDSSIHFEAKILNQMFKQTTCSRAGLCHCGKLQGDWRWAAVKMEGNLVKILKHFCYSKNKGKDKSFARICLEAGSAILCLQEDPAGQKQVDPSTLFFFHIGYVNFKTWTVTVSPLYLQSDVDCGQPFSVRKVLLQHICLEESNADLWFQTLLEALSDLDTVSPYSLMFFKIDESTTLLPLSNMKSGLVQASKVDTFPVSLFWRGSAEEAVASQLRSRPVAPAAHTSKNRQAGRAPVQVEQGHGDQMEDLMALLDTPPPGSNNDDSHDGEEAELDTNTETEEEGSDQDGHDHHDPPEDENPFDFDGSSSLLPVQLEEPLPEVVDNEVDFDLDWEDFCQDSDGAAAPVADAPPESENQQILEELGLGFVRKAGVFEERFDVPGFGHLRFNSSNKFLRAHCQEPGHGSTCLRRRTCLESDRSPGQGRPAGMLLAWLALGADVATKEEHMKLTPSFEKRSAARQAFEATPGASAFSEMAERPRREGEPAEPRRIP